MSDTLRITILGDGTIRTETDRVSAPNHQSAEQFLAAITVATGGAARRDARHGHAHHHTHTHVHADGHTHD